MLEVNYLPVGWILLVSLLFYFSSLGFPIPYTGSLPSGSDPVNYVRPKMACLIDPLLSPNEIMSENLFKETAEDDTDIANDNESDVK